MKQLTVDAVGADDISKLGQMLIDANTQHMKTTSPEPQPDLYAIIASLVGTASDFRERAARGELDSEDFKRLDAAIDTALKQTGFVLGKCPTPPELLAGLRR